MLSYDSMPVRILAAIMLPFATVVALIAVALAVTTLRLDPVQTQIIVDMVLIVATWFTAHRWLPHRFGRSSEYYDLNGQRSSVIAILMIAWAACLVGAQLGSTWVMTQMDSTDIDRYSNLKVNAGLLVITTLVLTPIMEEMLMRRVLLTGLTRFIGPTLAVWISTLTFALIHGTKAHMALTIPVGLLCGYAFVTTGAMRWPIGLHIAFNTVSVFVPASWVKTHLPPTPVIAATWVALVVWLTYLMISHTRAISPETDQGTPAGPVRSR